MRNSGFYSVALYNRIQHKKQQTLVRIVSVFIIINSFCFKTDHIKKSSLFLIPTMARAIAKSPAKKATKKSAKKAVKSPAKKAVKKSSAARSGSNKERILHAIASRAVFGEEKCSRAMIMGLALITSAKSFSNILPDLKKRDGYVDYDANSIWLTEKGRNHVGPEALAVPENNDAMQAIIRSNTLNSKKAREIFDELLDSKWYTRDEIAAKMNMPKNKSFQNAVGSLSKIVDKKGGKIRLSDICFPCGRPE